MQLLPLGRPGGFGNLLEQPGLLQPLCCPGESKGGVNPQHSPFLLLESGFSLLFPQTGLMLDQPLRAQALGSLDSPPHSLDFLCYPQWDQHLDLTQGCISLLLCAVFSHLGSE